ncbi:MAG TPA: hypothetical protein VK843_01670 [Planctomycetota bacterium]|nr:hypothetical protein [Planctomycetota bacterium]
MSTLIRSALRRAVAASTAWLALVSVALCNTWIVDQANGPGAHFTTIPPAIAAAAPGDVILVRHGYYGGFTLTRGMTVLGQGLVEIFPGSVAVSAVPAGEVAALCNFRSYVAVDNCTGTVLLQGLDGSTLVQASTDVRIREANANWYSNASLRVVNSRVQLGQSRLVGFDGWDAECISHVPATPGGDALTCQGITRLHFTNSLAYGGTGGYDDFDIGCWLPAGQGGKGIATSGPGGGMLELILCGSQVHGGSGGGTPPGPSGPSMVLSPNVTAWSSQTTYSPTAPLLTGGTYHQQPTTEPTLELIGVPTPGAVITLRLHANPGVAVRLNVGRKPIVQPATGILIEGLVLKERSFDRGLMPPSGFLDSPWLIQPGAPAGKLLIFQVKVTNPSNNLTQKSNSVETLVQ